jgi:hypothetical protein
MGIQAWSQMMSPDDTLRFATKVEGLFPETTPEQVSYLAGEFVPYDAMVVESVLKRFRRLHETLNIRDLLRRIADEQERRTPRRANRDEERKLEAERKRENDVVSRLSDDELDREKQAIIEATPALRSFLADKDPRNSPSIRAMILNRRAKNG